MYNFIWYHSSSDNCCFIIALQYTDNKFLYSGLQGNEYNSSNIETLNHGSLNHAVNHSSILQPFINTEMTIYQENIQLAQIKFFHGLTHLKQPLSKLIF